MEYNSDHKLLLDRLTSIANTHYPDSIRDYAINLWQSLLVDSNPTWKYQKHKVFIVDEGGDTACVLAIIDSRLPKIGIVGFFAASNATVGSRVLQQASDYLASLGKKQMVGPIDGLLLYNYRLNSDDTLDFFGEPVNPGYFIDAFKDAGFTVCNEYVSGVTQKYQLLDKLLGPGPIKKYPSAVVRNFNTATMQQDFAIMANISQSIFSSLSLYCPDFSTDEMMFLSQISKSVDFNPRYTQILEVEGKPVGGIMSIRNNDRLIVKTLGVIPEYQGTGLGRMLIHSMHQNAKEDGIKEIVYALIRRGNRVDKMPRPGVKVYRKYYTFIKDVS